MSLPERYGRYRVKRLLGSGSMATVYLAEDPGRERPVALKVIKADSDLRADERERLVARFMREYRVTVELAHPNIVGVYEVDQDRGVPYIAMQYLDGPTLDAVIEAERPMPPGRLGALFRPLASALDHAHRHGVVHRDLKPSNVILTDDRVPKITDFGLAKVASSTVLTRASSIIGTPRYMSPEQVTGHEVGGASDQFALAVILYLALSGERPFTGNSPTTIMYKIVHEQPMKPHLINPLLPEAVDSVLLRALAKRAEDRYPTCAALMDDLLAALGSTTATAAERPVIRAAAGGDTGVDPCREEAGGTAETVRAGLPAPSETLPIGLDAADRGAATVRVPVDEPGRSDETVRARLEPRSGAGGAGWGARLGRWLRHKIGRP